MKFKINQSICFVVAAMTALGALSAYAQSGSLPARNRSKVYAYSQAENVRELYVAILGEVANPGTYHLDPSEMNLPAVLKRAGGLTPDASKVIKIIRQGRVSHQETYSESENSRLSPGDVLIVDCRYATSHGNRMVEREREREFATVTANYQERVERTGVQIALVNVVDYPLVMTFRPEDATAVNIIEQLGQFSPILANTKLISSDPLARAADSSKFTIRLTSGSAVVFDRGAVDRSRLPDRLPRPIESDIALGAQSGLIGSPFGQSSELRNLGELMTSGKSGALDSPSQQLSRNAQESTPTFSDFAPLQEESKTELTTPSLASKGRIAVVPFTGSTPFTTSSTAKTSNDGSSAEPIPQPEEAAESTNQSTSESLESVLTPEEELELQSPTNWGPTIAGIVLMIGSVVGLGIYFHRQTQLKSRSRNRGGLSRNFEPASIQSEGIISATSEPSRIAKPLLELLIKNELPVRMETVEFPNELVLQGRIAAQPVLRVDGPENVLKQNGPHFTAADQESEGYSLQEVISQLDAPQESSVRRPHFLKPQRESVAEVASSVTESRGQKSVNARSGSPLANALFELEQGGRS